MIDINLDVIPNQLKFIETTGKVDEVLYGGAAGGGKSYGQVVDSLLFALKYPGSKQIIFRETYPSLEKSILRTMKDVYPVNIYSYNSQSHTFNFMNGSIIDCGFLQRDDDAYNYQSAEYDCIRFDELTHFTEFQYQYMRTRCRGANGFPKILKSSTNPTGAGRVWVKERFVDIGEPNVEHDIIEAYNANGEPVKSRRIFIPSKVFDNTFLMTNDPNYLAKLEGAPESERRGLLNGEWDFFEGQYFNEFRRETHVCDPFPIPKEWRKWRSIDYGLDMLACLWYAMDGEGNVFVYREFGGSDMTISEAVERILDRSPIDEDIICTYAGPDLWGRSQESGKSRATIFADYGLPLVKANNDREAGWLAIKEYLKVIGKDEVTGRDAARLHFFSNCKRIIKDLPQLIRDEIRPTDCAVEPHEITHYPDSLRYFCVNYAYPAQEHDRRKVKYPADYLEDYWKATDAERRQIEKIMGGIPL